LAERFHEKALSSQKASIEASSIFIGGAYVLLSAQKFLQNQDATCAEKSRVVGRKAFDLLCAAAANVPTFFFVKATNLYLAIFVSLANVSISWLGVSALPLTPGKIHPARRCEIAYMNEQLETFLKLPNADQHAIMDEMDAIRQANIAADERYKKMYARLLNLAKPVTCAPNAETIQVQEKHEQPLEDKILANALGVYVTIGQINYSESTYTGIAQLFNDPGSSVATTISSFATAFSLLPNGGFGFSTGSHAANSLLLNNKPLAALFLSKSRELLKHTINVISLFCGGSSLAVSLTASADIAQLTKMSSNLKEVLTVLDGFIAYSGAAIICAYYTQCLCDEILIYLAQRCAHEPTKKLFTFVLETKRLIHVLDETNDENYLELLQWKMRGETGLSKLLHSIFDNRLSEANYIRVQQDVNRRTVAMKDRLCLPHYQRIPSFFAREAEERQRRHPDMRQRIAFVLACCDGEHLAPDDIESQRAQHRPR